MQTTNTVSVYWVLWWAMIDGQVAVNEYYSSNK